MIENQNQNCEKRSERRKRKMAPFELGPKWKHTQEKSKVKKFKPHAVKNLKPALKSDNI